MSDTIDRRVVEMRFDNAKFQDGVKDTLKSLDNLNKGMKNVSSAEGLGVLADAAGEFTKKISTSMDDLVKNVNRQNSMLDKAFTMTGRWLMRFEDKIANTVSKYSRMFVFDPPSDGFAEYEMTMDAVQTIMAGTGESLETVNAQLQELNKYSDDTIYSFRDMKDSIGKFTNAGVPLTQAVASIKGIANAAALAGANANEASRAMYNFSQALSSGYVKLIDWKSIENANMATKEFKEQLIETAVDMKILKKQSDGTYKTVDKRNAKAFNATKNFNDALSDAWMTSEVLNTTLAKYASTETAVGKRATEAATKVRTFSKMMDTLKEAAGSGWARSAELIFGDFDHATKLFTGLSERIGDAINGTSDLRNGILELWAKAGGQAYLRKTLLNVVDIVTSFGGAIGKAFGDVFGIDFSDLNQIAFELYGHTLNAATAVNTFLKNLSSKKLANGKTMLENVADIFRGMFAVVKPVIGLVSGFVGLIGKMFTPVLETVVTVLGMVGDAVADLMSPVSGAVDGVSAFVTSLFDGNKASKTAAKFIGDVANRIKEVKVWFTGIPARFQAWFDTIKEEPRVKTLLDKLTGAFNAVKASFADGSFFEKTKTGITTWFNSLKATPEMSKFLKTFGDWWTNLKNKVTSKDFAGQIASKFGLLIEKFKQLKEWVKSAKDWLGGKFTGIFANAANFLNNVFSGKLLGKNKSQEGKNNTKFQEMIEGLGFGSKFDAIIKWKDKAVAAIQSTINKIKQLFKKDNTVAPQPGERNALQALLDWIKSMGLSIAGAINRVFEFAKNVDWMTLLNDFTKNVPQLVVNLAPLIKTIASLFFYFRTHRNVGKFTKGLAELGAGLGKFGKNFGKFSWKTLFGKDNDEKTTDSFGDRMLKLAGAIALLVGSLWLLSKISESDAQRGLKILGILAAGMVVTSLALSKAAKANVGKTILAMAAGLTLLLIPLNLLANMDTEKYANGLVKIGLLLGELGLLSKLFSVKNTKTSTINEMIKLAIALILIMIPFKQMAKMQPEKLATGLFGMGVLLLELAAFMGLIRVVNRNIPDMKPLLLLGVSLIVMMIPFKQIANMEIEGILKGIVGLGTVMLELVAIVGLLKLMKSDTVQTGNLIALAVALSLMMIPFGTMAHMNMKQLVKGVAGLGAVMLELSVIMQAAKSFKGGAQLLLVSSSLILLMIPMEMLAHMPDKGFNKAVAGIAALGLIMATITKMGRGGVSAGAAVASLGSVLAVIGIIAVVLAAIKGLDYLTGGILSSFVGDIFEMIGEWIGKLINGIGVGAAGTLKVIGEDIANFANALSGVTEEQVSSAGNIALMMIAIGAAEVLTAVANLLGGGTADSTFKTKLTGFADAMCAYSQALTDPSNPFNADAITNSENAAQLMLTIASGVPTTGGLLGKIRGEKDWDTLNTGLVGFAEAMAGYSKTLMDENNGYDKDAITNSKNAVDLMFSISSRVPMKGGLTTFLKGEADWDTLTTNLPKFAEAMAGYSAALTSGENKFDSNAVDNSKTAADLMIAIANGVPRKGGLVGLITGDTNWDGLSKGLPEFAKAMAGYSAELANPDNKFDSTVIESSETAASLLISLLKETPPNHGFLQLLLGKHEWGNLSNGLVGLAAAMVGFSKIATEINAKGMETGISYAESLITMLNRLPKDDSFWGWWAGENTMDFSEFGTNLTRLGQSMMSFVTNTSSLDTTRVWALLGIIESLVSISEMMNQSLKAGGDGEMGEWNVWAFDTKGIDAMVAWIGYFAKAVSESKNLEAISTVGETIATAFATGFSGIFDTTDLGTYIVTSIADGIENNAYRVTEALEYLTDQVMLTMNGVLDRISSGISTGFDPSLSFRPVYSMGDMGGANSIGALASTTSFEMNNMTGRLVNAIAASDNSGAAATYAAANAINARLDNLSNRIASMAVVMDTGALVGALRDKMDKSLGHVSTIKLRTGG